MRATDVIALAALTIAVVLGVLALLPTTHRKGWVKIAVLAVLFNLPVRDLSVVEYVRSLTGDPSVTSMVLLAGALGNRLRISHPLEEPARRGLLVIIVLAALLLYPASLTIGAFDPYRWGFADIRLVAALLVLAFAGWYWRMPLLTGVIALALIAHAVGLLESTNLWDYLLDVPLAVYAAVALIGDGLRVLWRRLRSLRPGSGARA